jgi:PPOX class probable F420-dependent enzyme
VADLELVRRLADTSHLAVIATTRDDGSVHASLVSAGLLDDPVDGTPAVAAVIIGSARKLRYLRRQGRAAAVFTSGYEWATVEGPVRIIGPDDTGTGFPAPEVPDLLRRVFVAAGGAHDDWEEYDRVMAAERRAAVFVHAARVSGVGRG